MPKVSPIQTNFTAGEFSEKLYGRFDISKYIGGAKTLENILIHQAGGGFRRPGSKYVAEVKTSSLKTRLITFEFSTTQTYILELGNEYMRVYRNNGQVEAASAYELATPYLTAELFELQFAQDADTMWITHPNWKPRKLTRTGHNAWTIAEYRPELLTLDVAPGTAWAVGDTITGNTSEKTCEIIEVLTTTTFNVKDRSGTFTLGEVLTNGTYTADQGAAHPTFTLDPFGADASDDCPSCVAMFEQRIYFANTNNHPQKIWGGVSGYFDNMTIGTNAGDAFVYELATDKVNAIRWLKPGSRGLYLGTLGGTLSMTSGAEGAAITPTNVSIKRDTTYGAANILPEMIGSFVYYVDRDLTHLRELGYSFDKDAQQALDMTILSDHIAKAADPLDTDGFTQIAYQQSPVSRLWCVRNDGQLVVLTRQIDQEVIGWSRQLSGVDSRDRGEYESVAIIPTDGGDDEVWVIVKRYINGATVRYVEYFMPESFDHQQDAFFVDSGLSLDSAKTITDVSSKTVIDDMEYASAAAARVAYVSSDVAGYSSDLVPIMTSNTEPSGEASDNAGENFVWQVFDGTNATTTVFPGGWFQYHFTSGKIITKVTLKSADHSTYTIKDCTIEGSNNGSNFTVLKTISDETNWGNYETRSFTFSNLTSYTYYRCDVTATNGADYAEMAEMEMMETVTILQSYSESTIKTQGSYSLETFALKTESLNDTLTKTPASTIDLTGIDSIKLSVRASRTGKNFKIGFHDSGGTTTEHTIDITAVDTWQTETIDISAVTDANKDAIDSIIITILNADADNTFYIDNMYGPADYIIVTATTHGFVDDDEIKIVDIIGMTELNNLSFVVEKLTDDTFALKDAGGSYVDGTTYTAYISGGEARKKVTAITGLTHLVGEEVVICADGLSVATKIVSATGGITLDAKASLVHVGLPYISDIELLPYPEGSDLGAAIGKIQRTVQLIIKFYESLSVQYGPDVDNLDTLEEEALFTGDRVVSFPGDWSREGSLLLRQSKPLPLNVLSVIRIAEVTED